MQISLILAALQTCAPIAVIVFVFLLLLFATRLFGPPANQRRLQLLRFDRWLRERQVRSPRRVWFEIIALAVGTALLVTLIDWLIRR
jgi:hypothetical protein